MVGRGDVQGGVGVDEECLHCRFYAGVLGGLIGLGITDILDGLQSHVINDERSAGLVAAPTAA
ncbi:MAG TPA: hypothetical protein VF173_05350 [Thermoanaerobaculia bacterium]|nr:hypothetical protein [Thermoanaerobaculia bacterium]